MFDDILDYDKYTIQIVCPHCGHVILQQTVTVNETEIFEWEERCDNCNEILNEVLIKEV